MRFIGQDDERLYEVIQRCEEVEIASVARIGTMPGSTTER